MVSFLQVSPLKPWKHFFCPPHLPHATPISVFMLWSSEKYTERRSSESSSLCNLLHTPVTSSPLSPYIFLSTHCQTPSAYSSFLNVRYQTSHVHKTTGKTIVMYILICIFLDCNLEDKNFCTERLHAFPDCSLFLIFSWVAFWFVMADRKSARSS